MYPQYKSLSARPKWRIVCASLMIKIKLRQAMLRYSDKKNTTLTYAQLAKISGLSRATIESLGSRADYNTTLFTVDVLCTALECKPEDILEFKPTRRR